MAAHDFEWDATKASLNLVKHKIDFNDAINIFNDSFRITVDSPGNYSEHRYKVIGTVKGLILVVIYTKRNNCYRIISARKASKNERRAYNKS